MLAIFDTYDDAARELIQSLRTAEIGFTPLVIGYHGELPAGALCPFTAYAGIEAKGSPLFFNEVPVPEWCEIRQGTEVFGEVLRDGFVLGRIHYVAGSFRQVDRVDWLLPDGAVGHTDHYDRYGNQYATTHHSAGVAHQTVYRGSGAWEIEVNHLSRVITLRSARARLTFESLTDLVSYFIDDRGLDEERVLIDSLSYPLFVMRRRSTAPATTLFWQEPLPGAVPENMVTELRQPLALERIVFCDEAVRETVAQAHPTTTVDLTYLSHLGQFAEKSGYDPRRAFVLTSSDEIPGLDELLEAFPEVTFSVAALTLMSDKLHALARRRPNLVLTPTINHRGIRAELEQASVYLDINAGPHVLDVVRAAYHLDLVVLAHAPVAKAPNHSRTYAGLAQLQQALGEVVASAAGRAGALDALHRQHGPISTAAEYRRLFG